MNREGAEVALTRRHVLLLSVAAVLLAAFFMYAGYFAGRASMIAEAEDLYFADMDQAYDAQVEYFRAVEAEPGVRPSREILFGFEQPRPTAAEEAVRDLGAYDGRRLVFEELEERQGPVYRFARYMGGDPVGDGGEEAGGD